MSAFPHPRGHIDSPLSPKGSVRHSLKEGGLSEARAQMPSCRVQPPRKSRSHRHACFFLWQFWVCMIGEPRIVKRTEQPYIGIRMQAPFRGMFAQVNKQFPTLDKWLRQHGIPPAGPRFLRYHVIDMAGEMNIEVGVPVATPLPGDGRVKPGLLPAGHYASLIYIGLGLAANKRHRAPVHPRVVFANRTRSAFFSGLFLSALFYRDGLDIRIR